VFRFKDGQAGGARPHVGSPGVTMRVPDGTIRTADVAGRRPVPFALEPDAAGRAAVAAALGLIALDRLRFEGTLSPEGRRDLRLTGRLLADGAQRCVVTLAPVRARIDTRVERIYVAGLRMPEGAEVEMPEDDRVEPLPAVLDLAAVMQEALSLALPDYPRAPGAALGAAAFGPPGAEPITEADLRPFAALGALRPGGGGEGEKGGDGGSGG
jgi:uncharacterized metal-binding protein YceD (DUF177 family)